MVYNNPFIISERDQGDGKTVDEIRYFKMAF